MTTLIVLPWPLQSILEAAGGAGLVSPDSLSWRVFKIRFRFPSASSRLLAWNSPSRACALVYGSARQGGQRSLARSAPVDVAEQLTHALAQISTLPGTPALCREGIKLQVALINSPMHVKGYAAPETGAGKFADRAGGGVGRGARRPVAIFSRFSTVSGLQGNRKFIECHHYKLPIRRICWRGSRTKQSRRKSRSRTSLS